MLETDDPRAGALKTDRVTLRRRPQRAAYDESTIFAILDATSLCHVGFVLNGQPFVIPTSFGRAGRTIYLHGAAASRMLRETPVSCARPRVDESRVWGGSAPDRIAVRSAR